MSSSFSGCGFSKVCIIEPDVPQTYKDDIFLTFDIDWCCDEVLEDCIDLVERADVAATWFVTHSTPLLNRLRSNPKFELGIHPNFNFLFDGNYCNGTSVENVIDQLLKIVPEATSERSHSVHQSSGLWEVLSSKGITHECNHFIPAQAEIELKPWRLWNDLIKVPYFWEDDVACLYGPIPSFDDLVSRGGVKVFDFHPIHVFLNTKSMTDYFKTRELHQNPSALAQCRNGGFGTRMYLQELLRLTT